MDCDTFKGRCITGVIIIDNVAFISATEHAIVDTQKEERDKFWMDEFRKIEMAMQAELAMPKSIKQIEIIEYTIYFLCSVYVSEERRDEPGKRCRSPTVNNVN